MAAPRLLPSDATLAKWRKEGLTLKQIADRILREQGVVVSVGSVASALSRAGLTSRVRYSEHIPWSPIKTEHNKEYPLAMLRLLAKRDSGEPLTEDQEQRLESWTKRLLAEDAVVLYRYESEHGFYYVKRRPEDGDGFIRQPTDNHKTRNVESSSPVEDPYEIFTSTSVDFIFIDDLE